MSTLPMGGGLGSVFMPPVDGVDPAYMKAMRNQSLLMAGLGMLAGKDAGMGFGQSALRGLGMASGNYMDAMNTAYRNAIASREEKRRAERDKLEDNRYQREADRQAARDKTADERYAEEKAWREKQADIAQKNWEANFGLDKQSLNMRGQGGPQMGTIPSGYMLDPNNPTQLVRMPGGPADNAPQIGGKDAATARQKLLMIESARKQLEQAKGKFSNIQGGLTAGPLQGYLPTQGGQEFDAAIDQSRNLISGIFRVPGVGAMSDYETRLQQAAFPSRTDYESVTSQKLQTLDDQLAALERGYRDMLGEQAPQGMGGPTLDQPAYSGGRVEKRGNVTIEWQ